MISTMGTSMTVTEACVIAARIDPRIGVLSREHGPVFYAFSKGYDADPVEGTLRHVANALGLTEELPREVADHEVSEILPETIRKNRKGFLDYVVTIRFQYPLPGQEKGITYETEATSKSDAIKKVRKEAELDGHIPSLGQGRWTLTAEEV